MTKRNNSKARPGYAGSAVLSGNALAMIGYGEARAVKQHIDEAAREAKRKAKRKAQKKARKAGK